MEQRSFIVLLTCAGARPLVASAQKITPVIGYLGSSSPDAVALSLTAFREGLKEMGYEEGHFEPSVTSNC